jgi:hypothetical protein
MQKANHDLPKCGAKQLMVFGIDIHLKVADMTIGMLLFFLSHALFGTCIPQTFQYTI